MVEIDDDSDLIHDDSSLDDRQREEVARRMEEADRLKTDKSDKTDQDISS